MAINVLGIIGVAAVAAAAVAVRVWQGRGAAALSATAPDLASGHILVTGWHQAELANILDDFALMYDADSVFALAGEQGEALRIVWKRPIATDTALFLVNYLHYPHDFDLTKRQPHAVAMFPVSEGIAPDGVAANTLAKAFVPDNDPEHDVVHALLKDGRAFRISFTDMRWAPITEAKASAMVRGVRFAKDR
jgi:hypothetical protein